MGEIGGVREEGEKGGGGGRRGEGGGGREKEEGEEGEEGGGEEGRRGRGGGGGEEGEGGEGEEGGGGGRRRREEEEGRREWGKEVGFIQGMLPWLSAPAAAVPEPVLLRRGGQDGSRSVADGLRPRNHNHSEHPHYRGYGALLSSY